MKKQSSASQSAQVKAMSTPVPFLDLARQFKSIEKEILAAVSAVCISQQYVLGPEVTAFEKEAAAYLEVHEAIGCASGTDALWLSLAASGIGPSDSVITTPFTFIATASAIHRIGARPVFADIDPETLNICPRSVEYHIQNSRSSKLKALLPVHLYGLCADMDELMRIGDAYKLTVIEDAAQAFGATWRGRHAGAIAPISAFSFYPTKNLNCAGDGGMVTTQDSALAAKVRLLRNYGSPKRYYHVEMGWNSRLDSIQAAILRVKLKHIDKWNKQRAERAAAYDLLLRSSGVLAKKGATESLAPVRTLSRDRNANHVFHQYVIRCDRRDELRQFLADRKIGSEIYYPVPLHLQKCFAFLGYAPGSFPEAEKAAQDVLALPIYPELTSEEQATVVSAIADFYS